MIPGCSFCSEIAILNSETAIINPDSLDFDFIYELTLYDKNGNIIEKTERNNFIPEDQLSLMLDPSCKPRPTEIHIKHHMKFGTCVHIKNKNSVIDNTRYTGRHTFEDVVDNFKDKLDYDWTLANKHNIKFTIPDSKQSECVIY